jgi:hypothetical protein
MVLTRCHGSDLTFLSGAGGGAPSLRHGQTLVVAHPSSVRLGFAIAGLFSPRQMSLTCITHAPTSIKGTASKSRQFCSARASFRALAQVDEPPHAVPTVLSTPLDPTLGRDVEIREKVLVHCSEICREPGRSRECMQPSHTVLVLSRQRSTSLALISLRASLGIFSHINVFYMVFTRVRNSWTLAPKGLRCLKPSSRVSEAALISTGGLG